MRRATWLLLSLGLLGQTRPPVLTPEQQARRWLESLSLEQRIAQMVIAPFYGDAPDARRKQDRELNRLIQQRGIGGLILVNRVVAGVAVLAQPRHVVAFLNRAQRQARIPLIVAGDFERGVSMRLAVATRFPHAMAFGAAGDLNATRALGTFTAREARALGFHWIFAPDADVNSNPANPVIHLRSFGEDPVAVAAHVKAFIEGARVAPRPVLLAVKHFPGHGDTAVDSHYGLPKLEVDRDRLDRLELVPFRAAIAAGVDSVMSAHISLPQLDASGVPATVSPPVLTNLLRKELGFTGIVCTDAMDMQGLSKLFPPEEAAVRAIEAGTDVLLMPGQVERAIAGVRAAVETGRLARRRIDESLLRLLQAKAKLGLAQSRLVPARPAAAAIDPPEARRLAQSVAERAVTLLRNEKNVLPVTASTGLCVVVLKPVRASELGLAFTAELRKRAPAARVTVLRPESTASMADSALRDCQIAVVAAFPSVAGSSPPAPLYRQILAAAEDSPSSVLLAFGNPYLASAYPGFDAAVAAFSTVPASEVAAVKALFGAIPLVGKLPVSIPGVAERGQGLSLAPR